MSSLVKDWFCCPLLPLRTDLQTQLCVSEDNERNKLMIKLRCPLPSSSSSSSAGLMTTGGCVGLGTGSWVSVLMTPRSWGLAVVLRGGVGGRTGSSCCTSSFLFWPGRIKPIIFAAWHKSNMIFFNYQQTRGKRFIFTFTGWNEDAFNVARPLVKKSTVWLLTASWLLLPVTRDLLSVFLSRWMATHKSNIMSWGNYYLTNAAFVKCLLYALFWCLTLPA